MASIYDEIEIEDFEYDPDLKTYFYPCPCGDRFQITNVLNNACCGLMLCRKSCWMVKK